MSYGCAHRENGISHIEKGKYGTLHVRHFGVVKEYRLFRGLTADATTLRTISSITEGYTDKLDFHPHYAL